MKVWIKYLIGIALGFAAYMILPLEKVEVSSFIHTLSDLSVRIGRYSLIPLVFFGTSFSVYRLRSSRTLLRTSILTLSLSALFSFVLTLLGLLSALAFHLPRIPITGERMTEVSAIDAKTLIMNLFPFSAFDSLADGFYILPVFVFAAFIGAGCASEKERARPVVSFLESAGQVCHNVSSFFVEWISVCLIAISCWWMFSARAGFSSPVFSKLFLLFAFDFILFAAILCPLFIRFFCRDPRPFHVLYASVATLVASFFSADSNLSLQVALRHGRESLGIRDEANSFSLPLFSALCRGGSSLVISVCFVMIIRSYVDMGIRSEDVIWIFGTAFATSFLLASLPQGGTFVALTAMCTMYGRGFSDGYLLFRSALPLLCSTAAIFDATSALYGSYITAVKTKKIDHNALKKYI